MTGLYLPGAAWRPISYRAAAGAFTSAPLGWILHVTVCNGSPYGTFASAVSPNRRFSHAWVAKDGSSEQYQTLDMKSWAQADGNASYWSFETEGYPNEPLTPEQIDTLARWHTFLGAANELADAPGQPGIGTHYMGGAAWGGHTCPDPVPGQGPRSHQRVDILAVANGHAGGSDAPIPHPAPAPTPAPPANTWGVKTMQAAVHLTVDGDWGPKSDAAFLAVRAAAHSGYRGNAAWTRELQTRLGVTADGDFGPATLAALVKAVKAFQTALRVTADGAWGQHTEGAFEAARDADYPNHP